MPGALRGCLIIIILALTLGVGPSPTLAHGDGDGHDEAAPSTAADPVTGVWYGPQAVPLTPNERYVEQRNPNAFGSMVVWQEKKLGRDWDVVAYNLSTKGPAFPVTLQTVDQTNPVVRGPWIAWEERVGPSIDIVVLNLRTGEEVRVPDSRGNDDLGPTLGDRAVFWYVRQNKDTGVLRGYDLITHRMLFPAGNSTVIGPPSAWGPHLAWAAGNNLEAKINVLDRRTGERREVPDLWSVREGPVLDRWGVAFIAEVRGAQRGTYAILYDLAEGKFEYMRTGLYPHRNLNQCNTGVIWDQFSTDDFKLPTVSIWDGYTKKVGDFGYYNYDATCSGDTFLYEKQYFEEDPDLAPSSRIYWLDLALARPPKNAEIHLDEGLERGIYRGKMTFTGFIKPGDIRVPPAGVFGYVDGDDPEPIQVSQVGDGYKWRMDVDTTRYFSGQHVINVLFLDSVGTETRRGFLFFTDGDYRTNPLVFNQALNVPTEEPSPFPFNILDHYQDYKTFYNTVLAVIAVLLVLAWQTRKHMKKRPQGKPEYVRPDP